ncbi:MAG: hypothetical protein EBR82_40945 [Caulobacteraceae bacterium]|nr:hypothetical protein [Caulobacteraceae bacterium]
MNISFLDFWHGFNPKEAWLGRLFMYFFDGNINFIESPEEADVIIFSCFGTNHLKYKNKKRIFFTGENIRPPINECDYSLSFDYDSYNGKNFRLPLWYCFINWWNDNGDGIALSDLYKKWDPDEIENRPYFGSIIIGNPVLNRIKVTEAINKVFPVYGFGSVFNNPYKGSKIELLKNFKYNIAFENTIYPGYITEKLLEAKISGCIPIYWGTDVSSDFNENCIIRYNNDIDSLLSQIIEINNNKDNFIKKINEPLFKNNIYPNLDMVTSYLKKIFK